MPKPIIYSKSESGMALIYTLFAVLMMSLISVALLKTQGDAARSYNVIINEELSSDSNDYCVQAAFDLLKTRSMNGTLNTNTSNIEYFSPASQVNTAYSNSYTRPSFTRISNRSLAYSNISCSIRYIKDGVSSSGGSSGTVSKSRTYGAMSSSTIKYYRLSTIRDDASERVEYEIILSI